MNIHDYHAQELAALREAGYVFSKHLSSTNQSKQSDNPVTDQQWGERLLQGCAWLTARIQQQFDGYQLDWQEQMLRYLMPDALCPLPAMTIAHWHDPQHQLSETLTVMAGTELKSTADSMTADQVWQTVHSMRLHPLHVSKCQYRVEPSPGALIELELTLNPQVIVEQFICSELVFYLNAEPRLAQQLYYLLLHPATRVVGDGDANNHKIFTGNPFCAYWAKSYQQASHHLGGDAHRWLRWYFCFPQQFLLIQLNQLFDLFHSNTSRQWRLKIYLPEVCALGQYIQRQTLQMHCVPIMNLRQQILTPISLNPKTTYYSLPIDVTQNDVYQVTQVMGYCRQQHTSIEIPSFQCLQSFDEDITCYRVVRHMMKNNGSRYGLALEGSKLNKLDYLSVKVLLCAKTTIDRGSRLIWGQMDGFADLFQITPLMTPSVFQPTVSPTQFIPLLIQCLQHGQFNCDYLRKAIQHCIQLVTPLAQKKLQALRFSQVETFCQLYQGVIQQGNLLHIQLDEQSFTDRAEIFLWSTVVKQFCQSIHPMDRLLKLKWTLLPSQQTWDETPHEI